jgi:hypothetical protein
MNSAAINVDMEVYFGIRISSAFGTCPAVKLVDDTVLLFLLFEESL